MRLSSLLTCGIKPLWEATKPRIDKRRADREAAAADNAAARAALARAAAAVARDNQDSLTSRPGQMSWQAEPAGLAPPRPRPPTPTRLSRPAISPILQSADVNAQTCERRL